MEVGEKLRCENCLWNGRCVAIESNNNCDFYYDGSEYFNINDYIEFRKEYEQYLVESGYYD